jgi:hypothetical protein
MLYNGFGVWFVQPGGIEEEMIRPRQIVPE